MRENGPLETLDDVALMSWHVFLILYYIRWAQQQEQSEDLIPVLGTIRKKGP